VIASSTSLCFCIVDTEYLQFAVLLSFDIVVRGG
jgi:hypothetical protein